MGQGAGDRRQGLTNPVDRNIVDGADRKRDTGFELIAVARRGWEMP
jgi:hypothetical protein